MSELFSTKSMYKKMWCTIEKNYDSIEHISRCLSKLVDSAYNAKKKETGKHVLILEINVTNIASLMQKKNIIDEFCKNVMKQLFKYVKKFVRTVSQKFTPLKI